MLVKYVIVVTFLITSTLARVALDIKLDDLDNTITENETKTPTSLIHDSSTTVSSTTTPTVESNTTAEANCSATKYDHKDAENTTSETKPCTHHHKIDNGTALILTPYIKKGKIKEARKLSKVDPQLFLGVKSYSGFFTVDDTYNSNLFFWYFPVESKPVNETPWIVWLQGGPGASSLTGLFDEFGPFRFKDNELQKNPLTWLGNHSLLFIDNPVGTGYSFTSNSSGFVSDMNTYSSHLFRALQQFLQVFPELRSAPLYIAGESYAGKYVPALGMAIHIQKDDPGKNVNLQGFMIGNAFVNPEVIKDLTDPMLYFGILEQEQIEFLNPLLHSFRKDIENHDSIKAKQKWNILISVLLSMTQLSNTYNFLRDDLEVGRYMTLLRRSEIKRALHVGDIHYDYINMTVNTVMAKDFLTSTQPLFEELLEHYRVLAYCGQLDLILPCVLTARNHARWRWSGSDSFHNSTRSPYHIEGRLAGFAKSGGNFTEVVIRGAGHMVPLDAPFAARDLITRFIAHQDIAKFNPRMLYAKAFVDYYKKELYL